MGIEQKQVHQLLKKHFGKMPPEQLVVTERKFHHRVRADLQRAIDQLLREEPIQKHFCGVQKEHSFEGITLPSLFIKEKRDPPIVSAPQFEDVHIGEEETVRCVTSGLWLLEVQGQPAALFLEPPSHFSRMLGSVRFQLATLNNEQGARFSQILFRRLENAVQESGCYRGKILSLDSDEHYSGSTTSITVHRLRSVGREQVILPAETLELLERNVIRFVEQRPKLAQFGLATKKGLLFYGPPGTGKTHTIHYLAGALPGHTILLISAEQVGLLGEYMTLARLLQPSMVVIEDVDLIARDRTTMGSPCEEVLLNKLLNEMDGLKQNADILFLLTTNRPEMLEPALASRPGRIDQAIEFPLPDETGRGKLIRLYAGGIELSDDLIRQTVQKTEKVSAAFIKELMRRAMQFHLEQDDTPNLNLSDIDNALEELLFRGGTLNRILLGARDGE